jgi:hypothetical protein
MKKILFSLVALMFLVGGLNVLAQEDNLPATGITPDSRFYFLQEWREQIQTFFTWGAENKAKQFLHLADVRLAEYQKMVDKGKTEIAQNVLDKYEKQLDRAISKVQELKDKGSDIKGLSQEVSTNSLKHIGILEKNLQRVPESGKEGITKALNKIRTRIQSKISAEQGCIDSGGTVSTSNCCKATTDFPNLCPIGACGCSPDYSHEVKTCDCGPDKCFNGTKCTAREEACSDTCGNGTCEEIVCMAIGCPCAETKETCPSDCQ